jgi:hypothetical protein
LHDLINQGARFPQPDRRDDITAATSPGVARFPAIMPINPTLLSPHELLLLQALASGRRPLVTSSHRMRLELLGLVRDGPSGLQLTIEGHRRAQEKAAALAGPEKSAPPPEVDTTPRDVRGRRKRGRHTSRI